MRWKRGPRSRDLEDRRSSTGRRGGFRFPLPGGGGGGLRLPRGRLPAGRAPKLSLGGLLLLVVLFMCMQNLQTGGTGGGPGPAIQVPQGLPGEPSVSAGPAIGPPNEEEMVDFVSFVLDDLQETWARVLPGYRNAKLVLYRDAVQSGCGFAAAQMGPFYCPRDEKVYVDLSFYEELHGRFGAPGDFAQAYVLAHEIGHHVQHLTGIEPDVRRAQRANPRHANALSVRLELQADCLAGVWGHSTAQRDILERGDVEEGLRAAAAIGDDRLQRAQTGRVQPESFTHGSSRERVTWFRRGLESGRPDDCDTFGGAP